MKARIFAIRESKQVLRGKIQYFLKKGYDEIVSVSTIYRILGEKYQLRSKWKKNMKRGGVLRGTGPRGSDSDGYGGLRFSLCLHFHRHLHEGTVRCPGNRFSTPKLEPRHSGNNLPSLVTWIASSATEGRSSKVNGINSHDSASRLSAPPSRIRKRTSIHRNDSTRILRKECLGYGPYKPEQIPELQKQLDEFMKYYLYERPHLSLNMQDP